MGLGMRESEKEGGGIDGRMEMLFGWWLVYR
jgi:hypothetical protein